MSMRDPTRTSTDGGDSRVDDEWPDTHWLSRIDQASMAGQISIHGLTQFTIRGLTPSTARRAQGQEHVLALL
jgi:hypothetical protein